jgi:hypothetical protein
MVPFGRNLFVRTGPYVVNGDAEPTANLNNGGSDGEMPTRSGDFRTTYVPDLRIATG